MWRILGSHEFTKVLKKQRQGPRHYRDGIQCLVLSFFLTIVSTQKRKVRFQSNLARILVMWQGIVLVLFGWFPIFVLGSQRFLAPHKKCFSAFRFDAISTKLGQMIDLANSYPACAHEKGQRSSEVTEVKSSKYFQKIIKNQWKVLEFIYSHKWTEEKILNKLRWPLTPEVKLFR